MLKSVLDPTLVSLLVCPEDKLPLWFLPDMNVLYNERTKRVYGIKENIPVLLVDDSRVADGTEQDELAAAIRSAGAIRTGPQSMKAEND